MLSFFTTSMCAVLAVGQLERSVPSHAVVRGLQLQKVHFGQKVTREQYRNYMSQDYKWGGLPEMAALQEIWKVELSLVEEESKSTWEMRNEPTRPRGRRDYNPHTGAQVSGKIRGHVYLLYNGGHFWNQSSWGPAQGDCLFQAFVRAMSEEGMPTHKNFRETRKLVVAHVCDNWSRMGDLVSIEHGVAIRNWHSSSSVLQRQRQRVRNKRQRQRQRRRARQVPSRAEEESDASLREAIELSKKANAAEELVRRERQEAADARLALKLAAGAERADVSSAEQGSDASLDAAIALSLAEQPHSAAPPVPPRAYLNQELNLDLDQVLELSKKTHAAEEHGRELARRQKQEAVDAQLAQQLAAGAESADVSSAEQGSDASLNEAIALSLAEQQPSAQPSDSERDLARLQGAEGADEIELAKALSMQAKREEERKAQLQAQEAADRQVALQVAHQQEQAEARRRAQQQSFEQARALSQMRMQQELEHDEQIARHAQMAHGLAPHWHQAGQPGLCW